MRIKAGTVKPCEGRLSEATKLLLRTSRDRAPWGMHSCEVCGQKVGVAEVNGDWIPEKHWPSVRYISRKANRPQQAKVGSLVDARPGKPEDAKSEFS
jgi:hypothetical protein